MLGGAADPPGRGGTPGRREQCCTAAQNARDLRGGAAGVDPCGEVTARGAAGGPRGFSPDRCLFGAGGGSEINLVGTQWRGHVATSP